MEFLRNGAGQPHRLGAVLRRPVRIRWASRWAKRSRVPGHLNGSSFRMPGRSLPCTYRYSWRARPGCKTRARNPAESTFAEDLPPQARSLCSVRSAGCRCERLRPHRKSCPLKWSGASLAVWALENGGRAKCFKPGGRNCPARSLDRFPARHTCRGPTARRSFREHRQKPAVRSRGFLANLSARRSCKRVLPVDEFH